MEAKIASAREAGISESILENNERPRSSFFSNATTLTLNFKVTYKKGMLGLQNNFIINQLIHKAILSKITSCFLAILLL